MEREKRLTPEQQRMLSLTDSVRAMLRRNNEIKYRLRGKKVTDRMREDLKANAKEQAEDFLLTLQDLLLFMTEEEACDYLEGLKHIVTG